MTIWAAELTFATPTTSSPAASPQIASMAGRSSPITAAMDPTPTGTASCMNWPRLRTRRMASASGRAPAITRAEYSPRLWPAVRSGVNPRSAQAAAAATLVARSAGCVLAVSWSSASGPSKHSRAISNPSASLASAYTAFAAADVSAKARPIPTAWEPCPGQRNAIFMSALLPADQRGAPGEAASEGRQEQQVAPLDAAEGPRLFEGDVDRRGSGVAVPVDVDEHPLHGHGEPLRRGLDDPEVGLMWHEQGHVGGGEPVPLEDAARRLLEHPDRHLEHLVALHLGVVHPRGDGLGRRRVLAAAARLVEQLPVAPVGVEIRVDHAAVVVGGAEDNRPGGVGEEDAGAPVREVGDARERLRADAEHVAVL